MPAAPDILDRVLCDPRIMHGQPCIRGTRIPVSMIVASLADMTPAELRTHFPHITVDDIRAALLYAARAVKNDLVA